MKQLTLGSLFSGSGGFELAGLLCGIKPLWASEVEPFPIRVTTKRLPQVTHLGDINQVDGGAIAPVDIITAGFCCQDLSVAGKRTGLHGERSGLFFQIIRIAKEMRSATKNACPNYIVLENVPGMYSSNKGQDFQEVLSELIKIKDQTLSIPMPEKSKWSTSGEIVGDGFSLSWRTLDAQFWGVAQRRRRCFLVVDLADECAGQILFDESRLQGNPAPGSYPQKEAAGNPAGGTEGAIPILNDQGGSCMSVSEHITATLRAQTHGHPPIVFEPGAASRLGGHAWEDGPSGTLRSDMGDNQPAVVYDARGNGDGITSCTLIGDHENRITDFTTLAVEQVTSIAGNIVGRKPQHGGQHLGVGKDISYTLNGTDRHAVCYQDKVGALCACDYKFPQNQQVEEGKAVVEQVAVENYQHSNYRKTDIGGTLKANGGDFPGGENMVIENCYVVRRLTPTECARLQGFPDWWCAGLETPEPTDEDITFWSEVWETHRKIVGTSSRPKSRNQIIKWLRNPHSDSAEYKMWGNGVALPCVIFVLNGIMHHVHKKT